MCTGIGAFRLRTSPVYCETNERTAVQEARSLTICPMKPRPRRQVLVGAKQACLRTRDLRGDPAMHLKKGIYLRFGLIAGGGLRQIAETGKAQHFNPRHDGNDRIVALYVWCAAGIVGVGGVNEDVAVAEHRLVPAGQRPILPQLPLPRDGIGNRVAQSTQRPQLIKSFLPPPQHFRGGPGLGRCRAVGRPERGRHFDFPVAQIHRHRQVHRPVGVGLQDRGDRAHDDILSAGGHRHHLKTRSWTRTREPGFELFALMDGMLEQDDSQLITAAKLGDRRDAPADRTGDNRCRRGQSLAAFAYV